jgi:dienelactone hydrolase
MIERQIEIQTTDGRMNTFICHPERLGPHPAVIFLMDAPGIREELRDISATPCVQQARGGAALGASLYVIWRRIDVSGTV